MTKRVSGSKNGNNGSKNGAENNATGRARPKTARPAATAASVSRRDGDRPSGTLIIIGGHEDKEGDKLILRAVAERAGDGALVVVTVASGLPAEVWGDYEPLFKQLGVRDVRHLHVDTRQEALGAEAVAVLDGATAVFITGGDQLKLTSQLGDTPVYSRLMEIYEQGGTIAGTSAGASVMCETMLVEGEGAASATVSGSLRMAPGFGFITGVIIDQHFAERGRIGRLVSAVSHNPRILGIGIDENTAIVCEPDRCFTVLGAGAVYVLDGRGLSYTNLSDEERDRTLSAFDVRLHVLSMGDEFDVDARRPASHPAEEVERALIGTD